MNLSTSASSHVRLRMCVCVVRRPPQLPVSLANNAAITWTSSRSLLVAAKRTMRHELSSQQRVGAPGDIMRPYATSHLFNRCRNVSVYSFGLWLGTTRNFADAAPVRCLSCAVYFLFLRTPCVPRSSAQKHRCTAWLLQTFIVYYF